jgi:hypothetical protein
MSNQVQFIKPEVDLYCGYYLTAKEKDILIALTLDQFKLNVRHRKYPFQLIEDCKKIANKKKWLK